MSANRMVLMAATLLLGLGCIAAPAADENWPQFLGPGSRPVGHNPNLPEHWSDTENVAWKTDIPGRGWSSPIVWGNRVFLTTAVEPGSSEAPKQGFYAGGDQGPPPTTEHLWQVLCLDLASGKVLWDRTAHKGPPPTPIHAKNSYASETPVTDGQRVYALFGNVGIFCFDLDGKPVWSKPIAPHPTRLGWGTAASPVLHGDRVYILNDNEEDSYLLALDRRTGDEVWRVARDEKSNWSTPYVWQSEKRTEIVTAGTGKVRSYDSDGQLLWWLTGMSSITIATPYSADGLLYVSSGFVMDKQRPLYAIRPGAIGDITLGPDQKNSDAIAWRQPTGGPYNPTTLTYDNRVYVLYDRGTFRAFNAKTGEPFYDQKKLTGGNHFTASPWAFNGRVFCLEENGTTYVLKAGDTFEILEQNSLAKDDMCLATPAIAGDRLLVRSSARLYCIKTTSP